MSNVLQKAIQARSPLILDGAMGTELRRRGIDIGLPLWSANALLARPETVLQIHKEYIEAGADIITTNTFRTTRRTMRRANLPDRSKQLTAGAVGLAHKAREAYPDRNILIAGCIAPLEDCYRPDLVPPENALRDEHRENAERLVSAGVDFLLLETMNTIREAYAACKEAKETGKEVVVSMICHKDGTLYSGEPLDEMVRSLSELKPAAVSINCVSPRFLNGIIPKLRGLTSLPIAVYANVGVPEDERQDVEFTKDVLEDEYVAHARLWQQMGVAIIGGCCGTTPDYVKAVVKDLTTKPRKPVA